MKTTRVFQGGLAVMLIGGAAACANVIGLSDYETDEDSTGSPGGAGGATGGSAGTGAGRGGTAGGGTAGTGGDCIPTANARQCTRNDECCEYNAGQASCVNFPGRGMFCAARCTSAANCESDCCATLQSGNMACAFPEFCETGGTGGTGGSGGGIGDPCTTAGAACGTGTCNGGWCTMQCTASIQCPGNTWCIANNANTNTCFVGCTTSAQCAPFPGTTCVSTTDVSEDPISVCAVPAP